MKIFRTFVIVVIMLVLSAPTVFAGPECKTYTMHLDKNVYTFDFICDMAGIGAVLTLFNVTEYTQWWIYFFDGDFVYIPKLATFEYTDDVLYHIYYNGVTWIRSGMNFILNEE